MNVSGRTNGSADPPLPEDTVAPHSASSARLAALDAFRGFTIAGMLLVNNTAVGGAVPRQLAHAAWGEPITFADLIFPWFLFIVGAAIPFSANGRREKDLPRWRRAFNAVRRSALLFGIGLLLESSLRKQPVFCLGVLQIIALAYLAGRTLYGVPTVWRAGTAAVLLAAYGAALTFLPFPGGAAGEFSPDNNLALYLNRTFFAPLGLSGLTSVLPTAAMVLIGSVAGDFLRLERWSPLRRAGSLAVVGFFLLGAGLLWNLFLIMNKPVWTPPYIVYAAGWGTLGIALVYLLADVGNLRIFFYPLIVLGANALVAYGGAILFKVHILQEWTVISPLSGERVTLQQAFLDWCVQETGERVAGGWLYTCLYIVVWWLVCWYLYRRKIFLRA